MTRLSSLISVLSLQICCSLAYAGGPLVIQGATGNTPVVYESPSITVHVENGDLNSTIDNTNANLLIQEALDLWNNVTINTTATSTINLTLDTTAIFIETTLNDINASNFATVLPDVNNINSKADDELNPIVYDENGAIIDTYFGVGQSDTTIGFAASFFTINGNFYTEGFAVINGKDIPGLTTDVFKLLITHEIGHFIGLDHSQINIDNSESVINIPGLCQTTAGDNYPVMYPIACRDTVSLHLDDEVAVSALYPDPSFTTTLGILQGNLVDQTGRAIVGANVYAINTTTGDAVSITSDYLKQRNGFYKLHLPAGNYTLHANSINTLFNGGSGIGPYADTILDESFTSPHPLTATTLQDENTGNDAVITITTGSTTNISFTVTVPVAEEEEDDKKSSSGKILGALFFTPLLLLSLLSVLRRFR